jgi:signal transduction histidine kinase
MVPEILFQVKRIDTIINGLLHFAKPAPAEMHSLQVSEIVKSTIGLVEGHLKENDIILKLDLNECDPLVKGDEYLLQQVLLNVIMNACEALAEVDRERILAVSLNCREDINPETGEPQSDLFAYVEIEVTDNGPGIDNASLDSIFNPFFTTKHSGTGLGLATSHRIMEEHDGVITVSSELGAGSTFKLSLPVYSPDSA